MAPEPQNLYHLQKKQLISKHLSHSDNGIETAGKFSADIMEHR
jgi:hypothetical protein